MPKKRSGSSPDVSTFRMLVAIYVCSRLYGRSWSIQVYALVDKLVKVARLKSECFGTVGSTPTEGTG
jgi:hypothetical protein